MYVLYIKSSCPYCTDAESLLKEGRLPYKTIDLTDHLPIWEEIKEAYEWGTVPLIFEREDKFSVLVGGYTDLKRYLAPDE